MRVSPLKLQFDADSNSALVKISNDSQQKISVQLDAMTWTQDQAGQDQYSPTSEIVFFPRIFSIDPDEQRVVRVGHKGEPASNSEKTYRLYIQELPVQAPGELEMKFAVRMGIPVFVSPKLRQEAWRIGGTGVSGKGYNVQIQNNGNRFVKIGAIKITGRDAGGTELFTVSEQGWYVLAGRSRDFMLPLDGMDCDKIASIELNVTSDKGTRNKQLNLAGTSCEPQASTLRNTNQFIPGK